MMVVAVLEVPRGGAPDEHGDNLVLFEDELAQPVSCFTPGPKQVLLPRPLVGDPPVGGGFGGADPEQACAGATGRVAF